MSHYSDSESCDSDEGIRFKTDSVRGKQEKNLSPSRRERSRSRRKERSNSDDSSSTDTVLGPQLPQKSEEASSFGPQIPPHLVKKQELSIGPQLPHYLLKKEETGPQLQKEENSPQIIGPQLPPQLLNKEEASSRIGPQLPPHLRQKLEESAAAEENDDEDVYGPLPAGTSTFSRAQIALEERALQLKMDQLEPDKDKLPVREEWMLELPEVKAAKFGLGPRQFRSKIGPDMSDRSSWTDTPDKKKQKKEQKVDLKKEAELKEVRKRDEEQEKMAKRHKKKNKESLLDMHQSKMKKKKEEEPTERRPFSRETDLQVNRFDEAQKKAVLKKAQLLDDRFSSGQSKFL